MVALKSQTVLTPRGAYTVAVFINGIDYEVAVEHPTLRWTVVALVEQRDVADRLYAATVRVLTPPD